MGINGHIKTSRLSSLGAACIAAAAATLIIVTAGTIEGQSSSGSSRITVTRATPYPKSARAKITGMFMGWGKGRHSREPTVAIKFVPKGRATKTSISAPSITPKLNSYAIDSLVLYRAKQLKLGDPIAIDYVSYNGWVWLVDLHHTGKHRVSTTPRKTKGSNSTNKSDDTPQTPTDKFTYVGAKKIKTSGGLKMNIVVRRGSNMWSFDAPFEPIVGGQAPRENDRDKNADESDEPKPMSEQVDAFKGGDIVALKYKTDTETANFKFILISISPYKMTAVGKLSRVGTRIMRGEKHEIAYLRAGKLNLSMVVPLKGENAATTSASLKSLGKSEAVFTYYKQGGVTWLESVTAK